MSVSAKLSCNPTLSGVRLQMLRWLESRGEDQQVSEQDRAVLSRIHSELRLATDAALSSQHRPETCFQSELDPSKLYTAECGLADAMAAGLRAGDYVGVIGAMQTYLGKVHSD